jgi:PAS domain S-box-containing protein
MARGESMEESTPSDGNRDRPQTLSNDSPQDTLMTGTDRQLGLLKGRLEFAQSVLNSLPFNIAIVDIEGRIVAVNKAWLLFAEENEGPGRDFMEFNYFELCQKASEEGESSAAQALAGIRAVIQGGLTEYQQEYPCHSPNTRRWFRMRVTKVESFQGLIVIAHENITDEVEAQERQMYSHIDYHPVFDHSQVPMLIADRTTHRVIEVNAALAAFAMMSADQIVGRTPVEVGLIAPQTLAAIAEAATQDRLIEEVEIECRPQSDVSRRCLHWVEPITIRGIPCYLLRLIDITDQVREQERDRANLQKLMQIQQSIIDGFVSVTMEGQFVEFNEPFRMMVGYERDELRNLTYMNLTPAKWHAYESEIVADQVLVRGHSEVYQKEYRRKDGRVFPVELLTVLVRDAAGNPDYMWAFVRDISERKLAEDSLKALNTRVENEHEALQRKHEALQEVLNHIEAEKTRLKSQIVANIDKLIAPMIRQLQRLNAKHPQQKKMLDLLTHALDDISAPFLDTLATKFATLSPRELQICNLVKDGLQSKEIADLLGISVLTVSKIRQQIRAKLGLENEKISLTEFLQSLS